MKYVEQDTIFCYLFGPLNTDSKASFCLFNVINLLTVVDAATLPRMHCSEMAPTTGIPKAML